MGKIISYGLTRGKVAKNILLVLVLFTLILTIVPQNALAEENKQVNASEILDKIEKGELVAEENCTVIGDLDLSKINLSLIKVDGEELREVNNPISIKNSIIKGNVNFNDAYFSRAVNFDGTNLTGGADFEQSVFSSSANFENAKFSFDANFKYATFNSFTYFNGVNFTDKANFYYATFNRSSYFNKAHFNDEAQFDNAKFYNEVEFNNVFFRSVADFRRSEFYDKLQFNNATFNEDAQFDKAKFNDKVEFKDHTKFNETASFRDATFTRLADFEDAQFSKKADFTDTEFNEDAKFKKATFNGDASFMDVFFKKVDFGFARFIKIANFNHTEFNDEANFQNAFFNDTAYFILVRFKDRAYFTGASFNDTVDFSDADIFLTMKINWSQLEGKLVYDGYYYQTLIRNFETLGQSEDANAAYYKYHVERGERISTKSTRGLIRKIVDIFLYISCGYGVKPRRPLILAGIIIGSFAAFYLKIEDPKNQESKGIWKRFWGFVFLSVSIFTTLGKWNKWKPAKTHETKFRIGVIIEALLGWIIMTLFVISLTMTWIR
jgi:hypothetical protein